MWSDLPVTLAELLASVLWFGVTLYALFGGADFGAGFWDLIAGGAERGAPKRKLIEHSIGPVWEANHVWLIFVLVVMWTGFPPLFGAISSTLWIPFTLAAFGVIARGSSFAFRKVTTDIAHQRIFGGGFALSSVVTPFFLGAAAGAVAAGRVPPGVGRGNALSSWWNPVSVMTGVLAVVVCAYLAAVYLTADARRSGDPKLTAQFRLRALIAGAVAGIVSAAGLLFLHSDAPTLAHGLAHRALPLVIVSGFAGLASLALLYLGHFLTARLTAALAVAAVLWAWAVAQYPNLLNPGLTISQAAANHSVLAAVLISLVVGALLLVPSLTCLYLLFQHNAPADSEIGTSAAPIRLTGAMEPEALTPSTVDNLTELYRRWRDGD
ncbi:MAG TPA: cytochrome d ubiquinol oxidase subunit II [Acidimicrobiales bacterium]|jgi:cytochrome d ubiquinol oxidase subunit II|nr:cytochrome d ubiquinol oxidase subunit II [Acidimicrobiales bacterium]